jgi:hypothetical protein
VKVEADYLTRSMADALYSSEDPSVDNVITQNGVKGDVMTIGDAAITAGQQVVSSASHTFLDSDIGKWIQIVGAGVPWNARGAWAASTAYAANDSFVYNGVTYVVVFALNSGSAFTTNSLAAPPDPNAATLIAQITDVIDGDAEISVAAGFTVTAATCVFGTDDSAAFAALPAGDYLVPGNRTYFMSEWFIPSHTRVSFQPGVVIKLPYYTSTDAAPFRLLTSNRTLTSTVSDIHLVGTVTVDMSELTPPPGTNPRAVHVLNAVDCSIDTVIGVGIPGPTGNVMVTGPNQGLATTQRLSVRHLHNANVRGLGSSCVQMTGGIDIDMTLLTCDGGVGFRNEMDGNTGVTDNVRVGVVHCSGTTIWANSAATFTAHTNPIRNVWIGSILAEGGADGLSISYQSGGSVADCTVNRMRVSGGGRAVNVTANNLTLPGVVIREAVVNGATLTLNKSTSGTQQGVGFALAPGMTFYSCRAISCAGGGYADISQGGTPPVGSRATLIDCEATKNVGNGIYVRAIERLVLLGGRANDDPALNVPITAQMLGSTQTTGTLAGWVAGPGASGVSGSGGTLTVTANGTITSALARTAIGTSGVAVVAGNYYKFLATASAGSAPANATMAVSVWFYTSTGVAITPVANGSTAVPVPASGSVSTAFAIQAPPTAAFAAVIVKFFSNVIGQTLTNGWTMNFTGFTLQRVPGIAAQTYGIRADAGVTVQQVAADLSNNGVSPTTGAGSFV